MATDHGHLEFLGIRLSKRLRNERRCSNNVQGSHAEDLLCVEHAVVFEHLHTDGQSAIDWVRDDANVSFGTELGDCGCQVFDNASVRLE